MSEVQVSNARRVAFTAMALVAFAILTYRSYWMSSDYVYGNTDARLRQG